MQEPFLSSEGGTQREILLRSVRWFLPLILWLLPLQSQAQVTKPEITIELLNGMLNGRPALSWTLNEVTDLLGRPSAVENPVARVVGARLHYHEAGVSFWFEAPQKDPQQAVFVLSIYLSKTWDARNRNHFQPFRGTLVPAVDANWKADHILKELAPFNPKVETVEEQRQKWQASGVRAPLTDLQELIRVQRDVYRVNFLVEPNTKFLERVTITK
jgi:hypothetical protein